MRINPTIVGFIKKELVQALRDPRMRVMLFVTPLVQLVVFGLALSSDVRNVRLAAAASPGDYMMAEVVRDALGGGWFVSAKTSGGEAGGFDQIRSGAAEVALFPPEGGLSRAFNRGEGRLQALVDSANLIRARSIENYLRAIASRVEAANSPPIPRPEPPASLDVRVLYNPELVSAYYLVPGVVCMLICIITIMLTAMAIAKERESGTFEALVSAPVRPYEILLGKTTPFIAVGSANVPFVIAIAVFGFGVPLRGEIWELALATAFFIVTTVSIGTMISTISRTQQQAMMGGFLFIMPAILLSGILFPVENMPGALKMAAVLNPLRYFIALLRNIMLKGGEPAFIARQTAALAALAASSAAIAAARFRTRLL